MKQKGIILFSIAFFLFNFNTQAQVKNVIFLIGDGMGLNHVHAARVSADTMLNIERADAVGLINTYSANKYITDSAAGGTALASGVKTKNGMIGMNPDSVAVYSILHDAQKNKLATGIVVTSSVTHATPASFVAHQINRKMEDEIAEDIVNSSLDVFIGGGSKFFMQRKDSANLITKLTEKGYGMYFSLEEAAQSSTEKKGVLLAENGMPSIQNGRGNMLPEATKLALNILSKNKKGFFLMVEGSQIDWAAHDNNLEGVIQETLDFDKAVGIAMDFADKNKGTLVIITADHETGGMQITGKSRKTKELKAVFTTTDHSPVPVPLYAYGTGADKFSAFMNNTDIKPLLFKLYKFK